MRKSDDFGPPAKKKKFDSFNRNSSGIVPSNHNSFERLKKERKSLPIYPAREKIISEIRRLSSSIVIGETGSGKTTQIPQYLFEAGVNSGGIIAVTQPRRVAAISVAKRVADEKNCNVGTIVGHCVRFDDQTSHATKIKFMTDGMLLREAMIDPDLKRYNIVILDEAHERTVNTDVLFGVIKAAQRRRIKMGHKILKIIVMSATMDVDHFSKYFNNAQVLYLEGRQFPVKVMYASEPQSDYAFASMVTLFQIHKDAPAGEDVLIFLTGEEEIENTVQSIKDVARTVTDLPRLIVLPLYAAMNPQAQSRVFEQTPAGCRKVIVATNIAETSITISGVKFVIDSGMVKAKLYNPHTGLDILKVVTTSKAQVLQRTGRAGREAPGVCYCLFTEKEFINRPPNTIPEIQRCNLGSVVLQIMALGVSNVMTFDFLDKPSPEALRDAQEQLVLLGALEKDDTSDILKLTPIGKRMASFPLDPRFSKTILLANDFGCLEEILSIVSVLSVDTVLVTSSEKRKRAEEAHQKFISSDGDHITLLNIYRAYKGAGGNQSWCFENFINSRNMHKAKEVRKQLREICTKAGMNFTSCAQDTTAIRRCLAVGFFINAAELTKEGEYVTLTSRTKVFIHPNSALFRCKPACLVYTELIKTSKNYMRDVSLVDPDWLMEAAPAFFKRKKMITKS